MTLRLNSPVGGAAAVYNWPLPKKSGYDGTTEILDTIKWGCRDIPDLEIPLKRNIMINVDVTSFESMHALCQRYNKAIDSILRLEKGTQKFVDRLNQRISRQLLRHVLQQTYNAAISDAEELNKYQAFSPDVYGETSFDLVCQMIDQVKITKDDVFVDLGSGVGQVVLQVAAATMCKMCVGIERSEVPATFSKAMHEHFTFWMRWYGKCCGKYELIRGDFFDDTYRQRLFYDATVIFVNNFAFGPSVDHRLKERFAELKQGTKIVSSKSFCSLNFRISDRNLSDVGTIMDVTEISPLKSSVSWTCKPVTFYLHVIDRTKLERYFQQKMFKSVPVAYETGPVERPRKRKRPKKTGNSLKTMLDRFKLEYTQMVEQMSDPKYREVVRDQIRKEIARNAHLKQRVGEIDQEIEQIILIMRSKIS